MYKIILTIDIISAILVIVLVLLQQGKGANVGISFNKGASNTLFGSKGSSSFLFKITILFMIIFFLCCLTLGYLSKNKNNKIMYLNNIDSNNLISKNINNKIY